MTTQEIAHDLVALCQQGKFDEAGEKYWADDVVSVEAMGDDAESHGKAAVRPRANGGTTPSRSTTLRLKALTSTAMLSSSASA